MHTTGSRLKLVVSADGRGVVSQPAGGPRRRHRPDRRLYQRGQVALGWLLAKGDDVVPIPGTQRIAYVEENTLAAEVSLTAEEVAQLDAITVTGDRHADRRGNWTDGAAPAHLIGGPRPFGVLAAYRGTNLPSVPRVS